MLRPITRPVRTLTALAIALSACNSDSTTSVPLDPVASLSGFAGTAFSDFTPLPGSAACVVPPSLESDFASYAPFSLPTGYTQTILATELKDFLPVAGTGAGLPDMMTLNETGPMRGRFMYRTHEVGSNGALTVTDLQTGVTTVATQETHYEALDGIVWTPWGTVLFAEERIVASLRDPRVPDAVGGLVYEYNPRTGDTRPLPAVGARSHEGLRFDAEGNLYGISESTPGVNGSGALYKFVPDQRGDLSSGQLYALKVTAPSRTGLAKWVPLDRALVQINSDEAAINVGATGWGRPEDIEFVRRGRGQIMYVTSTSEALVLRIQLDGVDASVSNFLKEGVNITGLNNPDNLEVDEKGNLYVLEDNGPGDIWFAGNTGRPQQATDVRLFASLSDCAGEPTGMYFHPNGRSFWVHVQHAGGALRNDLFVEISQSPN